MAYTSNKELLEEIHKCKMTYCSYVEPEHCEYDGIFSSFDDFTDEKKKEIFKETGKDEIVVRIMTNEHIPVEEDKKKRARVGNSDKAVTNFPPFKHLLINKKGETKEVVRSHWEGGIENGKFNIHHGRVSNKLGVMFKKLVENYSRVGKFRSYSYLDEMKGNALTHLVAIALKFDESKTSNPFGFYSKSIYHCFIRVLNVEKRVQDIRDDLLQQSGAMPSITRQIDNEFSQRPEYNKEKNEKLVGKRGRKSAVAREALEKAIKDEHDLTK